MTRARSFIALLLALALAGPAAAQQIYRWTDAKGGVHITDTPPPASAREVQQSRSGGSALPGQDAAQTPFATARAMKDFPVTLYTSPPCKEPCSRARESLNQRGVPFREVQVWNQASIDELKRVSGGDQVPVLLVGRSVQQGFDQTAYNALLDSARYPQAGTVPPRKQAAPSPPEGYADSRDLQAQPVKPQAEQPAPLGPYAPRPAQDSAKN